MSGEYSRAGSRGWVCNENVKIQPTNPSLSSVCLRDEGSEALACVSTLRLKGMCIAVHSWVCGEITR